MTHAVRTTQPATAPRCLVAPDKFKGSLDAVGVAAALRSGLHDVSPGMAVECLPVADGGDGTLDVLAAAGFDRIPVTVQGPTGAAVRTSYVVRGGVAVVELADACGLTRLPDNVLVPLDASSFGLGQVMANAIEDGCRELIVGLGGSASTDGGMGMLQALGASVVDAAGRPVVPGGRGLARVAAVDLAGARDLLGNVSLVVASDVDHRLLGPSGAAATFGPQKGASPEQVRELDAALARWAQLVEGASARGLAAASGAGAAGGTGFAALALGATMRSGIGLILDLIDFRSAASSADVVITGEGRLDHQSLSGKAPVGVVAAARSAGVPVVLAVTGSTTLTPAELERADITAVYQLTSLEPDIACCLSNPVELITRLGRRIARDHLLL